MPKLKHLYSSLLSFILLVSLATPAYAYLDPGTGSLILQGLIAGLAMISFTFKMWWYKLTSLFKKTDDSEDKEKDDSEKSEPATPD
ncbi:MAG: hypothetical protein HOH14_05590 [Gammaproteobacteria bacterium]|jgi:hypothetical protein|nr:hypothetical protein [Gammaproteobacteria bacterium]MBT6042949.1 hypothetical protein [Gammaproteobacteria bacterium]